MPRSSPASRRRQPLSRERIAAAAVQLVDAEGAEALTMRRVGQALGVEAMSLYRHVEGREGLLDAMFEALVEEQPAPAADEPWQERIRAFARSARAVAHAHPRAWQLVALRPVRTPAVLQRTDALLQALGDAGLPHERAVEALRLVGSFTTGYLLEELAIAEGEGGRVTRAAARAIDEGAYPALAAAGSLLTDGDLDAGFDAALELVVRAVEVVSRPVAE